MKEKQVFHNAKWIVVCKIIQSIMQLIIGMLSARYLGPSNYGLLNYAASIVAFAVPFMKLGFDAILVYELVSDPKKDGEIIGTSLFFNFISSLICVVGVSSFAAIANYGERETFIVCALYSLSLSFGAIEMIQYWFQYKLLSKYSSIIMLISYVFVSAYKIFLLATAKNIYWFALSHSIEYGLIGLFLLISYHCSGGDRLKISFDRAKKMLSKSKHYIFASLMVIIIQNTDHIMLTSMIGKAENGYYSAAITSVTVLQFVYIAIVDSFRPFILEKKKSDQVLYEKNVSRLYGITLYLAIAQCICFSIFSELIITVLYGKEYLASAPVMSILSFCFVFSLMGLVRNVWVLAEEKQKYLWMINLSGVLCNIVLNSFMIPHLGACGAAFASLLTQFFMNFVMGFIFKPLRHNNMLMLKGLNPKFLIVELKTILKELLKKE